MLRSDLSARRPSNHSGSIAARRRPLVGALCLSLLIADRSLAQSLETYSEGMPAGRLTLFPSIALEYGRNSNIFYRSQELPAGEIVASDSVVVKPRLVADLPFRDSHVRLAYSPMFRDYRDQGFPASDRITHYSDFETVLRSGRGLTVALRDHLVDGTIELQTLNERGNVTFGLGPYRNHAPELEFTADLGARQGVSVIPRYTISDFRGLDSDTFYHYIRRQVELRYNYRVSMPLLLYGYSLLESTDQDQGNSLVGSVHGTSRTAGIGLRRTLGRAVVTSLTAGYTSMRFADSVGSDFSGPVFDLVTTWQLGGATRVDLALRRQPYPSLYVNNNYYLDLEARLQIAQPIGRSVVFQAAATYMTNTYSDRLDASGGFSSLAPSAGEKRRDEALRMEIGFGYQLRRSLRLVFGYNSERRDSNIEQQVAGGTPFDPFHYNADRVFFRIEAGWL